MAVCLHCLHAERLAARDRRQRTIVRLIAWTLSIMVVAVVGAAGVNAASKHVTSPSPARAAVRRKAPSPSVAAQDSATLTVATTTIELQGAPAAASAAPLDSAVHATTAVPPVAPPPPVVHADSTAAPSPVIGPILPQGRTDLPDSVYAIRRGDTVVVNFDTGPARTRRADKFELVVRQTLHNVYGPVADTLLATVPTGKLASASELVTTLRKRGIHLQGPHGPHLALWPETRPGRDGPLLFAYRTVVER
jgi:hypothetical protein